MAKPIIELTKEEFDAKSFSRPVIKETCSYDGDWDKLDFESKEYHVENFLPYDLKWLSIARKSPKVFEDGIKDNWNYLHVPYNWKEDMTIYRIYPIWDLNQKYRTTLHKTVIIKSVLAYQLFEDGRWFWKVNFEYNKCEHSWDWDKLSNGEANIMKQVCTKCGKIVSRPFTIKF